MTKIKSAVKSASRRIPKTARAVVQVPAAELVTPIKGQPMTDSLLVAAEFGKSHKHVLRSIDALQVDLSPGFYQSNFGPTTYTDSLGREQRMFHLTQAGFTALVMGFTGKKSVQLRERFIVAFQRVTAELSALQAMQTAPAWQIARTDAKRGYRFMARITHDLRVNSEKPATKGTHIAEARVVAFAMTGDGMNTPVRDKLPPEELRLLDHIQFENGILIARGLSRPDRKNILRGVVLQERADRAIKIGVHA